MRFETEDPENGANVVVRPDEERVYVAAPSAARLEPSQAREMAAALLRAADEAEGKPQNGMAASAIPCSGLLDEGTPVRVGSDMDGKVVNADGVITHVFLSNSYPYGVDVGGEIRRCAAAEVTAR